MLHSCPEVEGSKEVLEVCTALLSHTWGCAMQPA